MAHGAPAEADTRQIAYIVDVTRGSFVPRTFTDGAGLRGAAIERFEVEALGWAGLASVNRRPAPCEMELIVDSPCLGSESRSVFLLTDKHLLRERGSRPGRDRTPFSRSGLG
jgi:hypothetical protein